MFWTEQAHTVYLLSADSCKFDTRDKNVVGGGRYNVILGGVPEIYPV